MLKKFLLALALCSTALSLHAAKNDPYTFPPELGDEVEIAIPLSSQTVVGGTLATGLQPDAFRVPCNMTLTKWELTGDANGSGLVDVLYGSLAAYPNTSTSTIVSASTPTASSVWWSSGSVTNWGTTNLAAGWYVRANLVSVTTWKRAVLHLIGKKRN